MTDLLNRGDVFIAPWWDGRALELAKNGGPVAFVRPQEGAYATIVEYALPKNGKNKELAYKFIEMALSPEAQAGFAKDMFYGPTNKKTKLPEELAKQVVYGENEVNKLQFVDWEYVSTVRDKWIQRWNKEIVPLLK